MLKDAQMSAASLYDGGWRAEDAEQMRAEYGLTDEEVTQLVEELKAIEEG